MSLLEIARDDIKRITTNLNEWSVLMTFKTPTAGPFDYTFDFTFNNSQMFTMIGLHSKVTLRVNGETGQVINTKQAHVTVSERFFTQNNYPIRDSNNEVNLRDHQVAVKDSTGKICIYIIREWYPDETLELVVCILGDLE
jgi:hypothetical protein